MKIDAAKRASELVGTRFRPQGRDPATGLDCLGLILAAHRINPAEAPRDYRLRGRHCELLLGGAQRWFRKIAPGKSRPGDVLVMEPASDQLHLAVLTASGFIHADARLGAVVETPGRPTWPVSAVLRRRSRAKRTIG